MSVVFCWQHPHSIQAARSRVRRSTESRSLGVSSWLRRAVAAANESLTRKWEVHGGAPPCSRRRPKDGGRHPHRVAYPV